MAGSGEAARTDRKTQRLQLGQSTSSSTSMLSNTADSGLYPGTRSGEEFCRISVPGNPTSTSSSVYQTLLVSDMLSDTLATVRGPNTSNSVQHATSIRHNLKSSYPSGGRRVPGRAHPRPET
eukprot:2697579-Rhodomonas_salina.1